jgi:serine/threonine protein phosphatase 1
MSKTYAIPDLHGRFDLLEMSLAKIADHAELPATVVTLGDYVDRGPDSRQVIERLMNGLHDKGWRLICLKGNHEDIMWQTCRGIVPDCDWWLSNGGGATLISYGQEEGDVVDVTVVPAEHLRWIERLRTVMAKSPFQSTAFLFRQTLFLEWHYLTKQRPLPNVRLFLALSNHARECPLSG